MWSSLAVGLIGVWLMMAPSVLGYPAPARVSDWIVGPVVAMLGFVAVAEATRPVVRAAVAPGLWLLVAPWLLGYGSTATWNGVAAGIVITTLSLIAAPMDPSRYGGGWSVLWNPVLRRRMYDR
jgi:hypothetical protein